MVDVLDDLVLDFDLNYLQESSNDTVVTIPAQCKQRNIGKPSRKLLTLKKKIISTSTLIEKFNENKDILTHTENLLIASKEECRQVCIDYKNALEKCASVEKEVEILKSKFLSVEAKSFAEKNNNVAAETYSKQLELLLKERDDLIETLKEESKLHKAHVKELEKTILLLRKEKVTLSKDVHNLAKSIYYKKLPNRGVKKVASKYINDENHVAMDLLSEEEISESETDDFDKISVISKGKDFPASNTKKIIILSDELITKKEFKLKAKKEYPDHDSDVGSEGVSLDTGRGSSLAFSDSEKCFNSPDYFIADSPLSVDLNKSKYVDSATSPITFTETDESFKTPVLFGTNTTLVQKNKNGFLVGRKVDRAISPIKLSVANKATATSPKILVDKCLSPLKLPAKNKASGTSPKESIFDDVTTTKVPHASRITPKRSVSKKKLFDKLPVPKTAIDKSPIELPQAVSSIINPESNKNDETPATRCLVSGKSGKRTTKKGLLFDEVTALKSTFNEDVSSKEFPVSWKSSSRATDVSLFDEDLFPETAVVSADKNSDKRATPKTTVDRGVSPIKLLFAKKNTGTSPIKRLSYCADVLLTKQCLESNNRNNLCNNDDDEDCEIEMILNTMRLTHKLISPIPPTPSVRTRYKDKSNRNRKLNKISKEQKARGKNKKAVTGNCNINNVDVEKTGETCNVLDTNSELITVIEVIEAPPTPRDESSVIEENKENSKKKSSKCTLSNTAKQLQFENDDDNKSILDNIGDESIPSNTKDLYENVSIGNANKGKPKKLTRLQRLRKTMIPQNKIKKDSLPPTRKLRSRLQQLQKNKENAKASELKVALSNEEALQKAVKIMADLKLKENASKAKNIDGKKRYSVPAFSVFETDIVDHAIETPVTNSIVTRSRTKCQSLSCDKDEVHVLPHTKLNDTSDLKSEDNKVHVEDEAEMSFNSDKKRSKCSSMYKPPCTRILRSSVRRMSEDAKSDSEKYEYGDRTGEVSKKCQSPSVKSEPRRTNYVNNKCHSPPVCKTTAQTISENVNTPSKLVQYNDLDLFSDEPCPKKRRVQENNNTTGRIMNPQESVLCKMIDKHGITVFKNVPKKISDSVIKAVCKKLEDGIDHIIKLPTLDTKSAMNKLADDMQRWTWKEFLRGLMLYLMDPTRKLELFNKINGLHAPAMTNSEQVLLYIVTRLRDSWSDVDLVDGIFSQIEYTLFKLNHSPEFEAIESLSHFYAILCKYVKAKNRLRIFVLDAMYCLQFKAVPLIKQCIEVWFHILPLAHMGIAKSPLVTCVVYLLHYYKCEDKFNRVQDMRNILHQKYYFQITDWNETKILEMFKNAIHELRDNPVDRKMMRLALIILAKRQGPQWCQNKLIKNIIMPVIVGAQTGVSDVVKAFCVSMLGPLMKPYPTDMKVHCEIILNQLIDMLDDKHSPRVQEAIYSSLISMSKHNQTRVIQALLLWQPENISPDAENVIKCYVTEKPLRVWKTLLSKILLVR